MQTSHNQPLIKPLQAFRFLAGLATLLVALAQFAFKSSPLHDMCLGGALGLLISICVLFTSVKEIAMKNAPQPSDVNRYSIT